MRALPEASLGVAACVGRFFDYAVGFNFDVSRIVAEDESTLDVEARNSQTQSRRPVPIGPHFSTGFAHLPQVRLTARNRGR